MRAWKYLISNTIYPNPTDETLDIKGLEETDIIYIYSMSGQLLDMHKSITPLNLSKYSSGLYLIKSISENGEHISKVIKH